MPGEGGGKLIQAIIFRLLDQAHNVLNSMGIHYKNWPATVAIEIIWKWFHG